MKKTVLIAALLVVIFAVGIRVVLMKRIDTGLTNGQSMPNNAPTPDVTAQTQADAAVVRSLSFRLSSIEREDDKVSFVGIAGFSQLTATLSVDQVFRLNDRHYVALYSIAKIDSDGVILNYHYTGAPNLTKMLGRVRSGTIKLKWK